MLLNDIVQIIFIGLHSVLLTNSQKNLIIRLTKV